MIKQYIGFLRSINVGGKNLIKMKRLTEIFESAGMENVRTYIQSGNVIFNSAQVSEERIIKNIERMLHKELSKEVVLVVRTREAIHSIIKLNPFIKEDYPSSTKFYISFLNEKIKKEPRLPIVSDKKDVEIIHIGEREVYAVTREINGRFGFPNNFVEDYFGKKATTRNWNTIVKISELIEK